MKMYPDSVISPIVVSRARLQTSVCAKLDGHARFVARRQRALADEVGKNWVRGVVLYTGTEVIPFAANLHAIPLSRLWSH
jgi:hypothetical protein